MSATIDMTHDTASLLRELRDRDSETGLLTTNRLYRALLAEVARSRRYGALRGRAAVQESSAWKTSLLSPSRPTPAMGRSMLW